MNKFNTVKRVAMARAEADPLAGQSEDQLRSRGRNFADLCGQTEEEGARTFERAAILASETSERKVDLSFLPDDERVYVARENGGKWYDRYRLAGLLWFVAGINALMAAVQGMDETVINGAQIFFLGQLGIEEMPAIKVCIPVTAVKASLLIHAHRVWSSVRRISAVRSLVVG